MQKEILIAGFGGQGILFCGKFLAYKGLIEDKYVSWLPSYGPAMRGGTANCSIVISDEPIGSPIVENPDILIAMNKPSYEKYESNIKKGGQCFIDSSFIENVVERKDIEYFYIPATNMAKDNNIVHLANMIMSGFVIKNTDCFDNEKLLEAIEKTIGNNKIAEAKQNMLALEMGLLCKGGEK